MSVRSDTHWKGQERITAHWLSISHELMTDIWCQGDGLPTGDFGSSTSLARIYGTWLLRPLRPHLWDLVIRNRGPGGKGSSLQDATWCRLRLLQHFCRLSLRHRENAIAATTPPQFQVGFAHRWVFCVCFVIDSLIQFNCSRSKEIRNCWKNEETQASLPWLWVISALNQWNHCNLWFHHPCPTVRHCLQELGRGGAFALQSSLYRGASLPLLCLLLKQPVEFAAFECSSGSYYGGLLAGLMGALISCPFNMAKIWVQCKPAGSRQGGQNNHGFHVPGYAGVVCQSFLKHLEEIQVYSIHFTCIASKYDMNLLNQCSIWNNHKQPSNNQPNPYLILSLVVHLELFPTYIHQPPTNSSGEPAGEPVLQLLRTFAGRSPDQATKATLPAMRQAIKASIAFQIPYTTSFLGTYGHLEFFFLPFFCFFWFGTFLNSTDPEVICIFICQFVGVLYCFSVLHCGISCSEPVLKKNAWASLSLLHNSSKFHNFRNSSPMILIFMANQPTPNVSFPANKASHNVFIWFFYLSDIVFSNKLRHLAWDDAWKPLTHSHCHGGRFGCVVYLGRGLAVGRASDACAGRFWGEGPESGGWTHWILRDRRLEGFTNKSFKRSPSFKEAGILRMIVWHELFFKGNLAQQMSFFSKVTLPNKWTKWI